MGWSHYVRRVRRLLQILDAMSPFVVDVRLDGGLTIGGHTLRYSRGGGKRSPVTIRGGPGRLALLALVGRCPPNVGGLPEASRVRDAVHALCGRGRAGRIELVSAEGGRVRFAPDLTLTPRAREAAELILSLDDYSLPEWLHRRPRH